MGADAVVQDPEDCRIIVLNYEKGGKIAELDLSDKVDKGDRLQIDRPGTT